MDKLRIRAYNVGFGDALLVSVPDITNGGKAKTRHILIDVGSIMEGKDGPDAYLKPVIQDIQEVLEGEPVDLYVMTHEHMDHVKGLYYAAKKLKPALELRIRYAWLTASSASNYYERFPKAKKRLEIEETTFKYIQRFEKALLANGESLPAAISALMLNNNPISTKQCVDYIREISSDHTAYIYRNCDLTGTHPFQEASFDIWAPEEDTSDYYGHFYPMTLGLTTPEGSDIKRIISIPKPPPGVAQKDFDRLIEARRHGYVENLLAIDAAANNTSIVFCLNWRGWKLLFSGDAEIRSWKTMNKYKVLQPVHFIKLSHHGSANGMLPPRLLDKILVTSPNDNRRLKAVVSTCPGIYPSVPDENTIQMIKDRGVEVRSVHKESKPGGYIDIDFPPE